MRWQDLLINAHRVIQQIPEQAIDGMTLEELKQQPHPDSDNIAWLTWHMARSQDVIISGNMGEEQLWTKDKWHERFGREENTKDTGRKNTAEQIAAFKLPDIGTLLDYHRAVQERLEQYVSGLSEADLDKEVKGPLRNVGARLNATLSHNAKHGGQVAYLRDLIKGKAKHR